MLICMLICVCGVCEEVCVCVWCMCVWLCVWEAGGEGEGGGARDTESKTRTPHKDVGKKDPKG